MKRNRGLGMLRNQGFARATLGALALLFVSGALISVTGCSGNVGRRPKQVVIKLFGAMERNDKGAVANALDLVSLIQVRDRDYALNLDTPRVMNSPTDILDDLTGEGETKRVWFDLQRVVGEEEIVGDTAYVEVTFGDRDSGRYFYNKFGLHKVGDQWRIFSFRTPIDAGEQ